MEFNIEVRKKQLQSLDQYITSSKDKVQSILDYLGWNAKKLLDKEVKITCSVKPSHQIQLKNVEHIEKCCLKTLGYSPDEQFLSEPLHNPTSSIKLDNVKKLEILGQARYNNPKFKAAWNGHDCDPMTSDRIFSTFSVDERITLYDYCAKNTEGPPTPKEFIIHDDRKEEKLATEEELLVKERNSKRRPNQI
ncbi:hypothetical protein NQ318_018106 [Aromia moschata]|uniref:Uncharacterized protein n=1 Tax=Aromia moschata TaxID=1265417 RepID=A0AAV8ZCP0_9CUCU|nr:hypothetical protein NQ318_018106 [Aromia moschata]